ncbi:condensation domain-containing protein [Streptomyces sp. RKAG337]|uniref:condensation domain-containing protein n=1 Tax=Streptomyces sp. RKAG337 TaxID=2893404 RepID=UPI00203375FC|nr:condensation domain-containing protein [Streptomyces sp. RKAG337]MCM2425603.1 condensation domain-containing protein [Streptomyces sp. RKAG337]
MSDAQTFQLDFTGLRSAQAPLTWGQRVIYEAVLSRTEAHGYDYNIKYFVELDGTSTTEDVLAALRQVVAGYESLRTVYLPGVDGAPPRQSVQGEGRLPVRIDRMAAGADPEAETVRLHTRMAESGFDLSHEWGIRVTLLLAPGGAPFRVLLYLSHVALDGWALRILEQDLRDRLAGRPAADPAGAPRTQPLDLAEQEQSERGRAMNRRSGAYVRKVLDGAPRSMFAGASGDPGAAHGELRSAPMDAAARTIALRCQVSTATVHLAAFATLLARRNGTTRCALKTIFANRVGADRQGMVAPLASDVLLCPEVSGPAFDDVVRATHKDTLRGYARAQYDPADLDGLIAAAGAARGLRLDLSVLHNDTTLLFGDPAQRTRTPEETEDTAERESADDRSFSWAPPFALPALKLYYNVSAEPDGPRTVHRLVADTAYLPRDDVRGLLLDMETLLTESARSPGVPMAASPDGYLVRPLARGDDWLLTDSSWADLGAMRRALLGLEPVAGAELLVDRDTGGVPRVTARVVPQPRGDGGRPVTVGEVRRAYEAALSVLPDVVLPHYYIVERPQFRVASH